jgi:hypothetical protein
VLLRAVLEERLTASSIDRQSSEMGMVTVGSAIDSVIHLA